MWEGARTWICPRCLAPKIHAGHITRAAGTPWRPLCGGTAWRTVSPHRSASQPRCRSFWARQPGRAQHRRLLLFLSRPTFGSCLPSGGVPMNRPEQYGPVITRDHKRAVCAAPRQLLQYPPRGEGLANSNYAGLWQHASVIAHGSRASGVRSTSPTLAVPSSWGGLANVACSTARIPTWGG